MDFYEKSFSTKVKNIIKNNIEQNIRTICRDTSVDYKKCENLVDSYLFFIDKPILELTEYRFKNKSYYIDNQNRVYSKINNDYKLVGLFKKKKNTIFLFE